MNHTSSVVQPCQMPDTLIISNGSHDISVFQKFKLVKSVHLGSPILNLECCNNFIFAVSIDCAVIIDCQTFERYGEENGMFHPHKLNDGVQRSRAGTLAGEKPLAAINHFATDQVNESSLLWINFKNQMSVHLYDFKENKYLAMVDLKSDVVKALESKLNNFTNTIKSTVLIFIDTDMIVNAHKTNRLSITKMLFSNATLFVATSVGVCITVRVPHF